MFPTTFTVSFNVCKRQTKRNSDVEEDGNIGRLISFEDKDLEGLEVSYEDVVPVFTEVYKKFINKTAMTRNKY